MASRDKNGRSYGTGRTRNYATVVYQESAPADWQDILGELFISAFISPYHDKDKNPDGEDKKPHWHVMIMFDTVKTKEQAKEIFDKIGGVGCEVINSMRGYARYLCHLDNPDKYQYDRKDVICFSGADYENVIALPSDVFMAYADMVDFVVEYNITSYSEFALWARLNRLDWFNILCKSSYFIEHFIRSRYFDRKESISGSMNLFREEENFVNYAPLFRILGSRQMKRSDLLDVVSRKTFAKITKGISVDMKTIYKICDFLDCQPGDVMEFDKKMDTAPEAPADPAEHSVDDSVSEPAGVSLMEGNVEAEAVFVEPPVLPKVDRQAPAVKGNRYSRRHYKKVKGPSGGVRLSPP